MEIKSITIESDEESNYFALEENVFSRTAITARCYQAQIM